VVQAVQPVGGQDLDLGADVSGTPAVVYNPNRFEVEVYANSGGQVVERTWDPHNG
jgi:hypothetical protein